MPLWLLLALVVGGIAGITAALHMLGLSRTAPMSEADARAAWARHFPDDPAQTLTLNRKGTLARIETKHGRALLWRFGADSVARYLGTHTLTESPAGIALRFNDFTAPRLTLSLDPEERAAWRAWLEPT